MPEKSIYTVGQLNRELKNLVESSYRSIWVEGEVSGLSKPASGHMYFSLKEGNSLIRCAFFRNRQLRSGFVPEEGMQTLIQGQISYYEPRGDLQLIVSYLEESGEGALRRAFEMLKKRLLAEGLFEPSHKQIIPKLPGKVGIITSESGAVLQDILTTLKRRCPFINVILYPSLVQGDNAPKNLCTALEIADRSGECDVIIIARGGGSLDDLQAFNTETVARAVFQCQTPTLSAVGHETDFTIVDFVADQRAPTPTAAAEMVSPDSGQLKTLVCDKQLRLLNLLDSYIRNHQQTIDYLTSRLTHPKQKLDFFNQQQTRLNWQLLMLMKQHMRNYQGKVEKRKSELVSQSPLNHLQLSQNTLQSLHSNIITIIRNKLTHCRSKISMLQANIKLMGPQNTLDRGYAIVQDQTHKVVTDHRQLKSGECLNISVSTGQFEANVKSS